MLVISRDGIPLCATTQAVLEYLGIGLVSIRTGRGDLQTADKRIVGQWTSVESLNTGETQKVRRLLFGETKPIVTTAELAAAKSVLERLGCKVPKELEGG